MSGENGDGRRVVVTGCGAVGPLGTGVDELWAGLTSGRSGIDRIASFATDELAVHIAGEVRGFDPDRFLARQVRHRTDAFAQYAIAAAAQAHEQAGLEEELGDRAAVVIGSGYGAENLIVATALRMDRRGPGSVSPMYAATSGIDSASAEVALRYHARGPSAAMSTACATGTTCIGEAARLIRYGVVDVALAGAADDCINELDLAASARARALSTRNDDPTRASRPFDRARDGFVMAAGAGVVALEPAEHARRRGAAVLAEIAGYAASTDAHHVTSPHPEGHGARRAMDLALADARVDPSDVDHVNAHATSTPLGDSAEVAALRAVLGPRVAEVPISATKSMTGHMIGAAGAVELVTVVRSLCEQVVPPTINCDDPEFPDLDLPDTAREAELSVVMSNSFGFGGHNAVLVARRWEPSTRGERL